MELGADPNFPPSLSRTPKPAVVLSGGLFVVLFLDEMNHFV
jgi:hypothetical protein